MSKKEEIGRETFFSPIAALSVLESFRDVKTRVEFARFSIASLDYLSRVVRGKRLEDERKEVILSSLLIGVKINDYYDEGVLKSRVYKKLRRDFQRLSPERESDFRIYRRELSLLEKTRPNPELLAEDPEKRLCLIRSYREAVNRLSLAFCCSMAFGRPLGDFWGESSKVDEDFPWFNSFFDCVMAAQVVDDMVGRNGDLVHNRPSFYTAICSPDEIFSKKADFSQEEKQRLSRLFKGYLASANKGAPGYMKSIILAVSSIGAIYPRLAEAERKHPQLRKISGRSLLSERDRENL